jgi:LacI family transcriptional regulator
MARNIRSKRALRPMAENRRGGRSEPPRAVPKVAMLIETSNAYARDLMRGIVAHLREHRSWSIYLCEHMRGDRPPAWLAEWDGDGVIARIENPAIARAIGRLRIPVVDVSAARLLPTLPWVETDDPAIARLAADHLLERGFKNFGFCGDERFNWSKWRCEHFARLIGEAGHTCSVYEPLSRQTADSQLQVEHIAKWVAGLPKPVGVMACYDFRGQQLLDACRRRGIAVPDDVAVLGVDNDDLLCDLCEPPMSSVILNPHRTGYEAAALLDRMMLGQRVGAEKHTIEPLGIAVRQSTDVLAIEDPAIAAVVRYIREHACEGIDVRDVLKAHPQSRRLLEYRFRKLLGRTPHEEILRVRLGRVKLLLAESALSLEKIAELAGFVHPEYLSVVFRQKVGVPPGEYRTLNQRGRPASAEAAER